MGLFYGIFIGLVSIVVLSDRGILCSYNTDKQEQMLRLLKVSIIEEVYFRGFLLGYLKEYKMRFWSANLIQSLLFVIAHMPRYLVGGDWLSLALVFLIALGSGYVVWGKKNIVGGILLHFLANIFPFFCLSLH